MQWLKEEDLPEILTPEEEEKWILALELQNSGEARNELIRHNLRLVKWIGRRYTENAEWEDLMQTGTLGLVKAINSFKPAFKKRITTYASRCIENEIRMYIRKNQRIQKHETLWSLVDNTKESARETAGTRDSGAGSIKEAGFPGRLQQHTEEDPVTETVVRRIQEDELRTLIGNLPAEDRKILSSRYGLYSDVCLSQAEAAQKLGISQSCLSRKERKILKKLRNQMEG